MVDLLYHLINFFFFFFDIHNLSYTIVLIFDHQYLSVFNLRPSIICLSSGRLNLSLSISSSYVSDVFCD